VWQKAMDLCEEIYRLTRRFPRDEAYRLTGQLTRSAISVPGNIAEGHARSTARDYAHFLAIAQGSLAEAETYILLAIRFDYIDADRAQHARTLIDEVSKMLSSMRRRLTPRKAN
jgi:four helix bundle protein